MSKLLIAPIAAVLLWGALAAPDGAGAQTTPPHVVYGGGLVTGDEVAALVNGAVCGTSIADSVAGWAISVTAGAPCNPEEGDVISFTVNGLPAEETDNWTAGGLPPDVTNGITLTAASVTAPPSPTPPAQTVFAGSPELGPGPNLVVFNGGGVEMVVSAAPSAVSIWVTSGGTLVGYIPGALPIANQAFNLLFGDGLIPAGAPLILMLPKA